MLTDQGVSIDRFSHAKILSGSGELFVVGERFSTGFASLLFFLRGTLPFLLLAADGAGLEVCFVRMLNGARRGCDFGQSG